MHTRIWGEGTAQWLEHPSRDQKNAGSRVAGEHFSPWSTFCVDSISVSVLPLCYCSSMWKIPAILPKGQVAVKHTCTLHMGLSMKWHCKLVHGCTVYTECVLRQQQLHMAPAMQQPNSALSMPLTWIHIIFFSTNVKGYSHSFTITCGKSSVSPLKSEE